MSPRRECSVACVKRTLRKSNTSSLRRRGLKKAPVASMKNKLLNAYANISINSPELDEFDVETPLNKKNRRLKSKE